MRIEFSRPLIPNVSIGGNGSADTLYPKPHIWCRLPMQAQRAVLGIAGCGRRVSSLAAPDQSCSALHMSVARRLRSEMLAGPCELRRIHLLGRSVNTAKWALS
jgi:hypothetical protein